MPTVPAKAPLVSGTQHREMVSLHNSSQKSEHFKWLLPSPQALPF